MNIVDLNHSLQLRSAAAYATSLWERPSVKKLIVKASRDFPYWNTHEEMTKNISPLTKNIIEEVFCANLPEPFCLYVVHIVKSMASYLINWAKFLDTEYRLGITSTNAIQWTSTGEIDETKVFEQWFLNDGMLCRNRTIAYNMAKRCVHVSFLLSCSHNITKLSSEVKCIPPMIRRILDDLDDSMTSYLQKKYFLDGLKIVDKEAEKVSAWFYSAVKQGSFVATKFWLNEMIQANRNMSYIAIATKCVKLYQESSIDKGFLKEQYVKIMIFFMAKLTASRLKKFLEGQKCKILSMVISVWPEINFFLPIFENVKETLSISEFATILLDIISHFDQKNDLMFNYSECFYFELLRRAYFSFCKSIKKNLPDNFSEFLRDVIKKLFQILHVPGIRLIFDSQLFKNCKYSRRVIRKGILNGIQISELDCNLLKISLREIFKASNDVEKFKLMLNYFNNLIRNKKYCIASRFLMLLAVQKDKLLKESRFESFNSEINLRELCKILISDNEFVVAENLLNSIFETEEETENFKSIFSGEDFVKKKIYHMWMKGKKDGSYDAKHHITSLLGFLFKSEIQMDIFKKEKLIENGRCVKMFLSQEGFFPTVSSKLNHLEKFVKFCEIPNEKIAEIKKDLRENLIDVIMSNGKSNFFVIQCLLSWCTENDEEKKKIIKNVMMSVDIISLWNKVTCSNWFQLVIFCNEWIIESEDLARLKHKILRRRKDSYSIWENVFAKLIGGDNINIFDFEPEFRV